MAITAIRTRENGNRFIRRFICDLWFLLDPLQLAGVLTLLESHTDYLVGFNIEDESYSAET
jgi:hypothetical protein